MTTTHDDYMPDAEAMVEAVYKHYSRTDRVELYLHRDEWERVAAFRIGSATRGEVDLALRRGLRPRRLHRLRCRPINDSPAVEVEFIPTENQDEETQ